MGWPAEQVLADDSWKEEARWHEKLMTLSEDSTRDDQDDQHGEGALGDLEPRERIPMPGMMAAVDIDGSDYCLTSSHFHNKGCGFHAGEVMPQFEVESLYCR